MTTPAIDTPAIKAADPYRHRLLDGLADSIADLSELAGVATPTIDMMLALLKLRAAQAQNFPSP